MLFVFSFGWIKNAIFCLAYSKNAARAQEGDGFMLDIEQMELLSGIQCQLHTMVLPYSAEGMTSFRCEVCDGSCENECTGSCTDSCSSCCADECGGTAF